MAHLSYGDFRLFKGHYLLNPALPRQIPPVIAPTPSIPTREVVMSKPIVHMQRKQPASAFWLWALARRILVLPDPDAMEADGRKQPRALCDFDLQLLALRHSLVGLY